MEAFSAEEIRGWADRFSAYRRPPKTSDIQRWLSYFANKDHGMAKKILDNVELISEDEIHKGYQDELKRIDGWNADSKKRQGRWFFCGYGKPHESGPAMVRIFSEATGIVESEVKKLFFITPVEIAAAKLTAKDTLVFIDDIAGTGNQAVVIWEKMKELIASDAKVFLLLTAATSIAKKKIEDNTRLKVRAAYLLKEKNNIFDATCSILSGTEKIGLLPYCKKADKTIPKGYGGCGLIFVLSHKTPNNSIAILHANHPKWQGIFPRKLKAA